MLRINIPCPHDSGKVKNFRKTVPDHHALTKDEVRKLLWMSWMADRRTTKGKQLISAIQCRLDQGIKEMVCPCPFEGVVSDKSYELGTLYVNFTNRNTNPTPYLVTRLFNIMNWNDK